jgi:hypothetical protein
VPDGDAEMTLRVLLEEMAPDFHDQQLMDVCRRLARRYVLALQEAGVDVNQPETWVAFYAGVTAFEHDLQHGTSQSDAGRELTLVAAYQYVLTNRRR